MPASFNPSDVSDSGSVTSVQQLRLELEALKETTASLEGYLQHVRSLKSSLTAVSGNYATMDHINQQWLHILGKPRSTDPV